MNTDVKAYATAFAAGAALWTMASIAAGGGEPWDASLYWTIAYPAALMVCGGLGILFPHRAWRWPLVVMLAQMPVMIAFGSGLGLFPLGLILLAALSLPGMAVASLAGWLWPRPDKLA
ncbi:MAG: hypothetical protein V4527_11865 [Pseudomonadota bacterium]